MDVIYDEDFGAIWANHFRNGGKAKPRGMLLETLVEIMLQRDEFRTVNQDFAQMLDKVLATLGIPDMNFVNTSERPKPSRNNNEQDGLRNI